MDAALAASLAHLLSWMQPSMLGPDGTRPFTEEFGALYLPSLIRTYLDLKDAFAGTQLVGILRMLTYEDVSSFAKFLRDFPIEAGALYLKYAEVLVGLVAELERNLTLPDTRQQIQTSMESFIVFAVQYLNQCPNDLPALPPSYNALFQPFITALRCNTDLQALLVDPEASAISAMFLSLASENGGEKFAGQALLSKLDRNPNIVWRTWEGRAGSDKEKDGSACTELKDGEEMRACSRCLAVRYCCREHQRSDWKRHKKFCFKPSW